MPLQSGGLRVRRTLISKRGFVRAIAFPLVVLGVGLFLLVGMGSSEKARAYSGGVVYGARGLSEADLTWQRVVYNLTTKSGFRRLLGWGLASFGGLGILVVHRGKRPRVRQLMGEILVRGRRGVVVEF